MKKEEIKSLLKNKANSIYMIMIMISFLLLNIVLNINDFIGIYYDNIVEKDIFETIEQAKLEIEKGDLRNDLGIDYTDYNTVKNIYKTILVSDVEVNMETKVKEILKDYKYVEAIRVEKVDFSIGDNKDIIDFIYIDIDDWKHCENVKNFLDNKGIATSYCGKEEFYSNYSTANNFSNIIKYFSIVMCTIIIAVSCNNIIKNEYKNFKLLNVIGYSKKDIRKIIINQLLFVMIIGLIVGIFISNILIYTIRIKL